ncbi:MAG: SDR family NAD(P)-dependent oxidoreductase [Bacteroidota bacterium]
MTVPLVTGATRVSGREFARQLAARGDHVLLGARAPEAGEAAAQSIRAAHPEAAVEAVRLDVTSEADVDALAARIGETPGRLDVLVNNAGADYDTDQHVLTADLGRVQRVWETNTLAPWRLAQALAPQLRASDHGRLVNVSSQAGQLGSLGAGTPAYSHSKAALNALTLMLAAALRDDGVLVNAVCPGWVRTEMGGPSAPRSVEQGAASVVWAATLPDDGPTGGFFRDGEPLAW